MIRQYLSNTNEIAIMSILQKNLELNKALIRHKNGDHAPNGYPCTTGNCLFAEGQRPSAKAKKPSAKTPGEIF